METLRLFAAVDPGDDARHRLATALAGRDLPGSLVPPPNWHLTLRFFGSVDPFASDRLRFALSEMPPSDPLRVRLRGIGAFPKASRASVLWVGVADGGSELAALAERVDAAGEEAGLGLEDRPFRPHLTVSRFRPAADVAAWIDPDFDPDVAFAVTGVTLYASELGPGGARYTAVDRFSL